MARPIPTEWITSDAAAAILSRNSGHTVSADYVRLLGNMGKLETWQPGNHVKLYYKEEIEAYKVRQNRKPAQPIPA